MAGRVAQNKRAVNDRQSAASNDALKNAKDHVMQNFELIADLDNSDGKFTKIVEAGLVTAKMVLSAEIYQNVIKTVLERELQTWKIMRENAIFEATKEAEERKAEMDDKDEEGSSSASSSSSSSLSSSNAGAKRGRDDPARDIVDDRLGFTKDDTDKLIKRIRQLTEVLLEQQKPKLDKEKFYQDLVKKVAQQAADADDNAEIKEVWTFECFLMFSRLCAGRPSCSSSPSSTSPIPLNLNTPTPNCLTRSRLPPRTPTSSAPSASVS